MKEGRKDTREPPQWVDDALIVKCARCIAHPGSKHYDGSGLCEGCAGSGWKVIARRDRSKT